MLLTICLADKQGCSAAEAQHWCLRHIIHACRFVCQDDYDEAAGGIDECVENLTQLVRSLRIRNLGFANYERNILGASQTSTELK